MILAPGDDIQYVLDKAVDGSQIRFRPGIYPGGWVVRRNGLHLQGELGAIVRGGRKGIRVEKARHVTLEGLEVEGAETYGIRGVECHGLSVRACTVRDVGTTCLLTANASNVEVVDSIFAGARREHGIYLSQSGDRLRVLRCRISDCGRFAVQVNANQPRARRDPAQDARSVDVVVDGVEATECRSGFQFSSVSQGRVRNCTLSVNHIGVSFYDDGAGRGRRCIDCTAEDCWIRGAKYPVLFAKSCEGCREQRNRLA